MAPPSWKQAEGPADQTPCSWIIKKESIYMPEGMIHPINTVYGSLL